MTTVQQVNDGLLVNGSFIIRKTIYLY